MSFADRLLLWLHVAFAIFTLGPVGIAMMVTPRYIRKQDLAVLRYLYRTTRIFGALTAGVFLFGLLLGRHDFSKAWFSAAMTLFIVSAVLLVLVIFDQRRAITAIDKAQAVDDALAKAPVPANVAVPPDRRPAGVRDGESAGQGPAGAAAGAAAAAAGREGVSGRVSEPAGAERPGAEAADQPATPEDRHAGEAAAGPPHERQPAAGAAASRVAAGDVASVERGRIAMMGGVINSIWLVILVLMVWNG